MYEVLITSAGAVLSMVLYVRGILLALCRDRRLMQRGLLFLAAGAAVQIIVSLLIGERNAAAANLVTLLAALFLWWISGGGDGLKRRLRAWADSFGGRLAPQGA